MSTTEATGGLGGGAIISSVSGGRDENRLQRPRRASDDRLIRAQAPSSDRRSRPQVAPAPRRSPCSVEAGSAPGAGRCRRPGRGQQLLERGAAGLLVQERLVGGVLE